MFKYLIILGIIFYILYKVGSFFFRAGAAIQQLRNMEQQQQHQQRVQDNEKRNSKKQRPKQSGEYVDYEEVK